MKNCHLATLLHVTKLRSNAITRLSDNLINGEFNLTDSSATCVPYCRAVTVQLQPYNSAGNMPCVSDSLLSIAHSLLLSRNLDHTCPSGILKNPTSIHHRSSLQIAKSLTQCHRFGSYFQTHDKAASSEMQTTLTSKCRADGTHLTSSNIPFVILNKLYAAYRFPHVAKSPFYLSKGEMEVIYL